MERGDGDEIATDVFGRKQTVLFQDPSDGFVRVAIEALNLVSAKKLLLAQQRQLLQTLPRRIHLLRVIGKRKYEMREEDELAELTNEKGNKSGKVDKQRRRGV